MISNQNHILSALSRIESKLKTKITVLIDTSVDSEKCVDWLLSILQAENQVEKFNVKTIDQCRGMEYSALVTISNEGFRITRFS